MTASAETAARLEVGDAFLGDLTGPTDSDWIRAELTAGASYLLTLAARDPDGDGPRSGAGDTMLEVFNGQRELVTSADDQAFVNGVLPDGGFHPQLSFSPADGGVHYFRVSSFSFSGRDYSGGYRLELAETRPAPEPALGAGPGGGAGTSAPVAMVDEGAAAARLEVGGVYAGVLDGPADSAWLSATLTAGTTYRLALTSRDPDGPGPQRGAKDTELKIYNGQNALVASMDDQAFVDGVLPVGGLHPRLSFTPDADGDYFFRVSSFIFPGEDYSGGFQLELVELPPDPEPAPDPAPGDNPTAGPTDGGQEETGPGDEDEDWGTQLWDTWANDRNSGPAYALYGDGPVPGVHLQPLTKNIFDSLPGPQVVYADDQLEADGYTLYGVVLESTYETTPTTFFNRMEGGNGANVLVGGPGDDYLHGHDGDDYLYGDGLYLPHTGLARSFLNPGIDGLSPGDGDDELYGGPGNDYLAGGGGNDHLSGHGGNNYLDGGPGDDTLSFDGGYGYDSHNVLIGGPGRDVFMVPSLFLGGSQKTTIRDFQDGFDRIEVEYDIPSPDQSDNQFDMERRARWDLDQIATETDDGVILQAPSGSSTLTILGADLADLQFDFSGLSVYIV